jgi:hypothetical protein
LGKPNFVLRLAAAISEIAAVWPYDRFPAEYYLGPVKPAFFYKLLSPYFCQTGPLITKPDTIKMIHDNQDL